MRIITGISNAHSAGEIQAYAEAGVDEFFVGYVPEKWQEQYGWELSCNRRETSKYQYLSKEELANVVDLIRQQQKKVFLTLNAHDYNSKQIDLLMKIMDDMDDVTFDGLIVSNPGIILELQRTGIDYENNLRIG